MTLIDDNETRRRVLLEDETIGELTDRQLFETLAAAYVLISELRVEAARRRLAFFADVPVGMGRADASSSAFKGEGPPPPPANSVIRKP